MALADKKDAAQAIYRWPAAFLCVGRANKDYYRAFGVSENKLFDCPHSIETERFSEPHVAMERQAAGGELGIGEDQQVLLFAGKFEDKKRPVPLMRAFLETDLPNVTLLLVGDGVLGGQVRDLAAERPRRFRVLPFQNQSKMPLVFRLGDLFVLPSAYGETWGLTVNEAMACGRPALVRDRVGCHPDVVRPALMGPYLPPATGAIFKTSWHRWAADQLGTASTGFNHGQISGRSKKRKKAVVKCLRETIARHSTSSGR